MGTFRTLVAACVVPLSMAAAAVEPWTREWIDDIWQAHLLARGASLSGSGAVEEAYFRDALRTNPKSAEAVELLLNYYASTGEPMLATGAALYGRLLAPGEVLWQDALERARAATKDALAAPASEAEQAAYKNGLDAMLAQVQANNLMLAEIEVRRLLTRFPRDRRLVENLLTFSRIGGEPALQAMHALVLSDLDPADAKTAQELQAVLEPLGLAAPQAGVPAGDTP